MFIDFVTYLEIRDDLSEEDKQYINSEIKKNMAKYHMEKDGIKYYVETKRPGVGLHLGVEFCISMQHKRYKKYIKDVNIIVILKDLLMLKIQSWTITMRCE